MMTTTPNAADCAAAIKATHDQEAVKRVVWDMVEVDYTSVAGGKPGPVKADGVWRLTAIKFNMTWEQGTR